MAAAKITGSIINITSILGSRVAGGLTPYIAAKAGLKRLAQSLALELSRYDIRVNSIAPGYVVTELNNDFLSSDVGEKLKSRIPGSEIVVDGGHLCSSL